jgi:hypothetical protein
MAKRVGFVAKRRSIVLLVVKKVMRPGIYHTDTLCEYHAKRHRKVPAALPRRFVFCAFERIHL